MPKTRAIRICRLKKSRKAIARRQKEKVKGQKLRHLRASQRSQLPGRRRLSVRIRVPDYLADEDSLVRSGLSCSVRAFTFSFLLLPVALLKCPSPFAIARRTAGRVVRGS